LRFFDMTSLPYRKILLALFPLIMTTQGWAHDHLDIHVGYAKNENPVPATAENINPQEVFNENTTVHLQSAVEPTIAVNPKYEDHIVAAWQESRISNGGALEIGVAYSKNWGKTWQRTTVPFQVTEKGITQRVSEPWLSYARDGSRVYLAALAFNATTDPRTQNQQGVAISASENSGVTWTTPRFLSSSIESLNEPSKQFPVDDKPAVTADPNHNNYAYVVWDRAPQASSLHTSTQFSQTQDGGFVWSPARTIYDPFIDLIDKNMSNGIENDCLTTNNVIVVLPKGGKHSDHWGDSENKDRRLSGFLLNFMVRQYAKPTATNLQYANDTFPYLYTLFDIAIVRSKDGGETWGKHAKIVTPFSNTPVYTGGYSYNPNGTISGGIGTLMRTGDIIPSYNVNHRNGFLYVVWQTGQFRPDQLPQIALSRSRDGGSTWSKPVQISRTPGHAPNPQAFTPFVAITKDGHVGILYADFRNDDKLDSNNTKTDVWLAIYEEIQDENGGNTGVGLDFVNEVRLTKNSFIAQNGPTTTLGVMTNGDYQFLTVQDRKFYAIYTKSLPGPFVPSTLFLNDPVNNATILLDDNYRQAPFVSIVDTHKDN
jgi:hypothetical protein